LVDWSEQRRNLALRLWGNLSTAEHQLKRIAKNETRAGILQRLDL
jgi:hypothetical protein